MAVHHQTVFVVARQHGRVFQPMTAPLRMHGSGFGVPVVESARDANAIGRRMSEIKANGNEFGAGALAACRTLGEDFLK